MASNNSSNGAIRFCRFLAGGDDDDDDVDDIDLTFFGFLVVVGSPCFSSISLETSGVPTMALPLVIGVTVVELCLAGVVDVRLSRILAHSSSVGSGEETRRVLLLDGAVGTKEPSL